MKLRLRGHSLRLRLERTEVEAFAARGLVEAHSTLAPSNSLVYGLERAEIEQIALDFTDSRILVRVPRALAERWTSSEEVGFSAELEIDGERVKILVEKDFRCLHKRAGEDESDQFPHPAAD